jgi:hypothetical protein
MSDDLSYPTHWRPPDVAANTQITIERLLKLRLTRFELGFCLGLLGHNPTPRQQTTLNKIVTRYPLLWDTERRQYEHSPRTQNGECADQK